MTVDEVHRNTPQDFRTSSDSSNIKYLKTPPQQIDAERSVLGAILISDDQFEKVIGLLSSEDFYQNRHRLIFDSMVSLYNQRIKIDLLTMKDFLERTGDLEEIGGIIYLAEIADETPHSLNADAYAQIVHDCAVLRQLLKSSQDIQRTVYERESESVEEIMSKVQQMIFNLGKKYDKNAALLHIKDAALDAFKRIEELFNNPNKSNITGIPSGFADLDDLTAGFQQSDLVIIAGRPSMGKTALAMNIAENAAIQENLKVAVFSLEMPALHLSMRSLSSLSGVNAADIRKGTLGDGRDGEQSWERLSHALNLLNEAQIYIDATPGISPLQISAISRRMYQEKGLDLIIVDYLQLLQMKDDHSNRATELANITRELKFLAKELEVPIIALSQLNRDVESRPNKRPIMADLRESGAIEQDADVIIFIYRDEVYKFDSDDYGTAEIIVAKHRNGDTGTIKLCFMKECTRFENLSDSNLADSGLVHDIAHA